MRFALVLSVLVACVGDTVDSDVDPGTESSSDPRFDASSWPDTVGTSERPAGVFAPSNYDGSSKLPVVLLLHGYGATGAVQDAYFEMSARTEPKGFILIVPDGTVDDSGKRFWNATDACCNFYGSSVDDVDYLLGLLDEVEETMPVDQDRVTLLGHSNGGFMSYRMACEASDRLAGMASLAGSTYLDGAKCDAQGTLSVLQIHGVLDSTIAYAGGPYFPSAQQSVQYWATEAACEGPMTGDRADYESAIGGAETSKKVWSGCEGNVQTELWTIEGGGHIPSFTQAFRDDLLDWLLAQRR
ncbi:MAG: polyhydroxybutyrate depolymerase [Kiritimatiellia bacterium]|jgi:polyhydroxybutyrate depolymerase